MAPAVAQLFGHYMATGGSPDTGHPCMDVNTDPHFDRAMDPDMDLGSNPGSDVTMAPGSM